MIATLVGLLEVEYYVYPKHQLVLMSAVVVGRLVVGALEPEFRAKGDRASYPVVPGEQMFRVTRLESCALAFLVIEELVTYRERVMN